jgi:hypothetical protein
MGFAKLFADRTARLFGVFYGKITKMLDIWVIAIYNTRIAYLAIAFAGLTTQ